MNKKLKIATAAVSVVMAGTMAFGMFGCNGDGGSGGGGSADTNATKIVNAVKDKLSFNQYISLCDGAYTRLVNKDWVGGQGSQQKITPEAASSTDTIELKFNIGDKVNRSISYSTTAGLITGTITLPDGSQATAGELKPVWKEMQNILSERTGATVTLTDAYKSDSGKIATAVDTDHNLSSYDIISDGQTNIAKYQSDLLDLSLYLDDMPNYAAFLETNSTVKDSLTFDGGSMFYAPYFDGYNDVEKYSLFKTNWVTSLLDADAGDTTQTWAASMTAKGKTATQASIKSYMGTTGSWKTDVLDKDGAKLAAGITVNYDKVLAAAKSTTAELGIALTDAAGVAYEGDSGNIVDLLNFVIDTKEGDVTGAKLLKVMQEYIKVAYYVGTTDTAFYTQDGYKLSDVFNGYCAAWDVDLFAALGRVMITNPCLLKSNKAESDGTANYVGNGGTPLKNVYLVNPRETGMQRHGDIVSWVGELYGVRGLESRYSYAYIDNDGDYQDIRGEAAGYDAMAAFNGFYDEGLVYCGDITHSKASHSYYTGDTAIESMAEHDFLNTQTPAGFKVSGDTTDTAYNLEEGYWYTANLTAVSKWDVNGNGSIGNDEYFRFTESWRSVKDSGIAVPLAAVQGNPKKLKAILTFIDYIFSADGQIMMAYGKPASAEDGTGGFWYNPQVQTSDVQADGTVTVGGHTYKGTFTFNGKTYASDTYYGKKYNPTLTQKTLDAYVGKEANGFIFDGTNAGTDGGATQKWNTGITMNYTDFARLLMGSALNFGNKLTSLEYQLTSEMGKSGAEKVDMAVSNDVIRHVTPALSTYTFNSKWYAIVPSSLPFTTDELAVNGTLNTDCADLYQKGSKNTIFSTHKESTTNLYLEIIMKGYSFGNFNSAFDSLQLAD